MNNSPPEEEPSSSQPGQVKGADFLDAEGLKADLKWRSVRGGAATLLGQVAKMALRTARIVILARLLTPEDYGLIAMVAAFTNFVMMFRDIGLSMATVQKAEVNHSQISTLFWINAALGLTLTLAVAALAPVLVWFYGEPRLIWVALALGAVFVFSGLTIQHQALLRRQMHFGTLAVIDIASMAVGATVAVAAAYFGAGYWSLVLFHLAGVGSLAIGVWTACGWRPGLPVRRPGIRSMLTFGAHVTSFNVINYFSRNVDKILLGRSYGPEMTGLYSKAYQILMLPVNQIRGPLTAVAIPALSRLQTEPSRYRGYYSKLAMILAFLSMPLMAFTAVCSESIILLLLGSKWIGATEIFRVMAVTGFIQAVAGTRGLVMLSMGQSRRYLTWGVINAVFTVVSFVIGLPWGAIGIALSYAILNYIIVLPSFWYCFRGTPVSVATFLEAISLPIIASLCMAAVVFFCHSSVSRQPAAVSVGVCFVVGLLAYLTVLALMPGGIAMLKEFISYAKLLAAKRR
jgi:PST family polysaccharide transporter